MNKNLANRIEPEPLPFARFSNLRGKVCHEMGMERRPYLDRVFMSVAGERSEFAKLAHRWLVGWDASNLAAAA